MQSHPLGLSLGPALRRWTGDALGILADPAAYCSLIYMAVALPLAAAETAILAAGLTAGAILTAVGIGLLLLLGCSSLAWGFVNFERELAVHLLGIELRPLPQPLPEVRGWHRPVARLRMGSTWRGLAFTLLKLPFGIFCWITMGVILRIVSRVWEGVGGASFHGGPGVALFQTALDLFTIVIGVAILMAGLHAIRGIGWAWGQVALAMLGDGPEQLQLAQAERQVASADRTRRELIVNVSHELRTPIATIRGHLDSLLGERDGVPRNAHLDHSLEVIGAEARRLGNLVDDLLTLARADSDELSVRLVPVEVSTVVRAVVAALRSLAKEERKVTLVHEPAPDLIWAVGDPDRLTQVLMNLLRNAITHTPPNGAVRVEAGSSAAGPVTIEVADTGTGISPADLPLVFERFFRADQSRARDSGGFGLGLSIARELVEAMGGRLTVASEQGVGTTFSVQLQPAPQG